MERICEYEQCTGCSSCINVCPASAIKMAPDKPLGFIHPEIDQNLCIDCHRCEKVCPVNKPVEKRMPSKCYAAISKDVEDLKTSASGGASSVFVNAVVGNGGVAYGCVQSSYKDIAHRRIDEIADAWKLKGSKYVQSDMGDCYRQAKSDLECGRKVLFIGTPCQIGGLLNYVGSGKCENLYTIDLCCHGVPSQKLLQEDVRDLLRYTDMPNDDVVVSFRKKVPDVSRRKDRFEVVWGSHLAYGFFWGGVSGHPVRVRGGRDKFLKDKYITAFMHGLIFRDNCYKCPYAQPKRCSDITIADFWGLQKCTIPQELGTSLVLVNTEKGAALFGEAKSMFRYEERPLAEGIQGNGQLMRPSAEPEERNAFLKAYPHDRDKAYDEALKKYRLEYRLTLYNRIYEEMVERNRWFGALNRALPVLHMAYCKAAYEIAKAK